MKSITIITSLLLIYTKGITQEGTNEIIIISTNDVHGRIDNFSKMAAYVQNLKKNHKDVFVFNGGDLINGNPVVDEAPEKGYPIFDLMNCIPYNMSCPGNHEFENGESVLQQRIQQSNSVYVCANMIINGPSDLKPIKPYHILHTSDGSSMAVIGLTANSSNPCIIKNVSMNDPVKAAMAFQGLRDSVDIFIALTHIGVKADSMLATKLAGLDLIVGGHSHTEIPHGKWVNGTLITQAGDKLRFLGKTVLTIKDHKIVRKSFEMIDVSSLTETDAAVQQKINNYNHVSWLNKVAGVSTADFPGKEAIGSLKTDALKTELKLDIAFDHVRNISYSSFPKGAITLSDIYDWDSYDYKTMRYELTAAEIRRFIMNSLKKEENPVLYVSGITYTVLKNENNEVDSIVLKDKNGVLNEHKRFSVGMNSFIACHWMKDIAAAPTELPLTSAAALIAYLRKHKKVDYSKVKRVFVVK